MENNPKIFVFQLKELIYTVIFILLAILLILLLIFMFVPGKDNSGTEPATTTYVAGTYSENLTVGNVPMEMIITVDSDHINSIELKSLSNEDTVTTSLSLIESSLGDIEKQVLLNQSTLNIYFTSENQYTYSILINTIESILSKASVKN